MLNSLGPLEQYLVAVKDDIALAALTCGLRAAELAGSLILPAFKDKRADVSTKSSVADLVTATDVAVEKAIREVIFEQFPLHRFVGEESSCADVNSCNVDIAQNSTEWTWYVDPIDGTTNFVHSFPAVSVSIGLARNNSDLRMGIIYNPATDELWFAYRGCGSFMRTSSGDVIRIGTSGCKELGCALVSTGYCVPLLRKTDSAEAPRAALLDMIEKNHRALLTRARDLRRVGSAACDLCFVAMGRTDSYFEFGIREWDIAAGIVILEEAGGSCSTIGGKIPFDLRGRNILVAATSTLREQLCGTLDDDCVKQIICSIENK